MWVEMQEVLVAQPRGRCAELQLLYSLNSTELWSRLKSFSVMTVRKNSAFFFLWESCALFPLSLCLFGHIINSFERS